MKIFKYAGPPGTGKSTALLNIVDGLLTKQVPPEDIVFTTFTRAGAHEAKERAIKRFNLSPSQVPYFKTLHSLCYGQLNGAMSLMTSHDWCDIAKQIGTYFSVRVSEEGVPKGATKGDALLSLWSLSRVLQRELKDIWENRDDFTKNYASVISWEEMEHFVATVKAFKGSRSKMDYTDILEQFLVNGGEVGAHYVIVDEAQDLSPLQWSVVRKLSAGCRELHIAGDDDQAIHEWNGAKPSLFIDHRSDEFTVLPQSYRIPKSVHTLATKIAKRIKTRLAKEYKPREDLGEVMYTSSLDSPTIRDIISRNESMFILVRNHSFVGPMADMCRKQGVLFRAANNGLPEGLLEAARVWVQLSKGDRITKLEVNILYAWMSTRNRIAYGSKNRVVLMPESLFNHQDLTDNYGLVTPKDMPWSLALDKALAEDLAYIRAIETKGTLMTEPIIEIATIHAVKGKEADNVILVADMSFQTHRSFEENPDAEHRVWYVGATRARKTLTIVNQNTKYAYDL